MEMHILEETEPQLMAAYPYMSWEADGRTHGHDVTHRPEAWAPFFADGVQAGAFPSAPAPASFSSRRARRRRRSRLANG